MSQPNSMPSEQEREIAQHIRSIERQLQKISSHPLIVKPPTTARELLLQFLKGAAFGLGSVAGAGIILSLIIYLLSQIQFVPILGDFIKDILLQIQPPTH